MRAFLKAIFALPLAILVLLMAVANRAPVLLSLDPFTKEAPQFSVTLPLWVILFGAVTLGVVFGGAMSWLAQAKHRRAERRLRREARHLRTETDRLREHAGPAGLAALPAPSRY